MATDIAKIGFGVETSQLEKGVATLNSFSASAKSANSSAQSVGTAMNNAAKVFAAAVAGMSKSISSLVSVMQGATTEQITAAKEAAEFADRVYRAAQAQDKLAASTQKVTTAIKGQYNAFLKMASNESVLNRINRVTGVTGLYGGSAMTSAMAFRQNMNKKEWNEASGQLSRDMMPNRFNTANIAAQFQDIGVTAAMGMNPLLIALQQGTQLAAVMNSMEAPLKGLKEAFVQIINPVSLLSIGLTALAVVGLQMVDWTGLAETGLNGLASVMDFVANNSELFTAALASATTALVTFKGAAVASALTAGFKALGMVLTGLGGLIASVLTSPITLTIAAVTGLVAIFNYFEDEINSFFGFDFVGLVKKAVNAMIGSFIAGFEAIWEGAKWVWDKIQSLWNEGEGPEGSLMDALNKGVDDALNRDYLGITADAVSSAASSASAKLKEWSNGLTETDDKTKKLKDDWDKLVQAVNEKKLDYQTQQQTLGANIFDTNRLEITKDLLSQLNLTNISQLPVDRQAELQEYISELSNIATQTEIVANEFNFAKETSKSFLSDLKQGLYEGESAWESFGNAVVNVLDKMIDKLLDVGVDFMFSGLKSMGLFSVSGGDGGLGSMIGDLFSFNAKGNAFDRSGIVNSPTLFKFAKGDKFGVMGEAGPEAIMPLKRGPDGSLGVRADAGVASNDVTVNVYNNANAQATVNQRQTSQGVEIDVMIDKIVSEKLAQPGTATNTSALAVNNRRLIAR